MWHGVLALLNRSLRMDARSLQIHLARAGLLVGINVALISMTHVSVWMGSPGLSLLRGIAYLNLAFMSILGVSYFSMAISEEKEEDTLGLMQMAGIGSLGILIGKTGGRLFQALMLVAVQYPLTQLSVTLGGVTPLQINSLYLGLSAYLILLAGFGLLCSTVAPNNRIAACYMFLGLAVYTVIPLVISSQLKNWGGLKGMSPLTSFVLDLLIRYSIFQQMGMIMTTGYGDPTFSWQIISNALTGMICFGLAWFLFDYGARNPAGEIQTRGIVPVSNARSPLFSPGRAWENPLIWKDFYFVVGGFGMIPVRLLFCLGLYVLMISLDPINGLTGFQVLLSLAIAIDAGRVMAASISDERRTQMLASLVILPRSTAVTLYSKLIGAMLGWLPCGIVDLLVSIGTREGRENFFWTVDGREGFVVTSFFLLIPHVSMALSTLVRWGAASLGSAIAIGIFLALPNFGPYGGPAGVALGIFNVLICIACHVFVILRFRALELR